MVKGQYFWWFLILCFSQKPLKSLQFEGIVLGGDCASRMSKFVSSLSGHSHPLCHAEK